MIGRRHPARVGRQALEKFPRRQKVALGDRITTLALDRLEDLVEARDTRQRRPILTRLGRARARARP